VNPVIWSSVSGSTIQLLAERLAAKGLL